MKFLFVLAAVILVASGRSLTRGQRGRAVPFIVGGEDSAKGRWPWQLSLQVWSDEQQTYRHTCGAVLLNENWVLCAAHCVMFAIDVDDYELEAGAYNVAPGSSDAEQILKIADWWEHPEFSTATPGLPHDIAMFKLAAPADTSNPNIQGVALASGSSDHAGNPECWITGWGRIGYDAPGASPTLNELNIPVFTNDECSDRWLEAPIIGILQPILPVHICVGDDEGTKSACQGDSGGPLSCMEDGQWVVAGITSRGWPDCEIFPSVYTRVSEYKQWIEEMIRDN